MILVTGATGHIGNVLVRCLLDRGEQVRALLLPGEDSTPLAGLDVDLIQGDVLDFKALLTAFRDIDVVFHLAGIISIMPGKSPLLQLVNVVGTRNVIQAARQTGVRRLVYTSSIHAIRREPIGTVIDENSPFDPCNALSAYDYSKAQASLEVLQAAWDGLDAVIVCPTGVIGPYDYRRSELGQFILDCAGQEVQFYFDGAYDFVDVRDVAAGQIQASEKGQTGETYILSGERASVEDIMRHVHALTGKPLLKLKVPMMVARFGSLLAPHYYRLTHTKPRLTPYSLETVVSNSVIRNTKAREQLGFSPRPLRETLLDTIQWFSEHRHLLLPLTSF